MGGVILTAPGEEVACSSKMRSFECLKGVESVWALAAGGGGCPVTLTLTLKLGAFENQEEERHTGRRGKQEEERPGLHYHVNLKGWLVLVVGGASGPARAQQWGRIHMVLPALE